MTGLFLPQHILDAMTAQTEAEAPVQACGMLSGQDRIVQNHHEMTNATSAAGPVSLLPEEVMAVNNHARSRGGEVLAVYCGRPDAPARPTEGDLTLTFPPNAVFLILSLLNRWKPELRGFQIHEGQAVEIPVTVFNGQECSPGQDYVI